MKTLVDCISPTALPQDTLRRDAVLIVGASLSIALCAKVQIPMWPVPLTMQTFGVLLIGAVLGSRRGAGAALLYLLEGAAGLPVFAGPIGGPANFFGPTAGYLLAFPIAAFVVGKLCESGWDRRFWSAASSMFIGQAVILLIGFLWLSAQFGPASAFLSGVALFLVGDAVKIIAAAALLPTAWRAVSPERKS